MNYGSFTAIYCIIIDFDFPIASLLREENAFSLFYVFMYPSYT